MEQKANIELYASKVTIKFELGHDSDFEFSRSNLEFPNISAKDGEIATKW